jgi:hypothetical protein
VWELQERLEAVAANAGEIPDTESQISTQQAIEAYEMES